MFQTLISLFGIAIVYRNLSLLEKFEVISKKKMSFYFVLLQLPLFIFLIFKDQMLFTLLYIGIFSITLIFYRKILVILAKNTYVKCHLRILDQMILLMKAGKSAQTSLKIVFNGFSAWEKIVFRPFESFFEIQKTPFTQLLRQNEFDFYFSELESVLQSHTQIIDQLRSFREGLRLRRNLRHKSRQVTQQIRAQALIATFIFLGLVTISIRFLNLLRSPELLFLSSLLFSVGFGLIFLVGGKIRWKT